VTKSSWSLVLGGLFLAGRLWAGGVGCQQDCAAGECAQTSCAGDSRDGGFCHCGSQAVVWTEGTYASWCRSWGRPTPGTSCPQVPTAEDLEKGPSLPVPGQPDLSLADADALVAGLTAKNPYVAALVGALLDDGSWVDGPFEGQIQDSHFDEEAGTTQSPALRFTGQVVAGGIGAAQIQIDVTGDLRDLPYLGDYVRDLSPSTLVPATVTGTVTDRGLHGALVVTAPDGKAEAVQW